MERKESSKQTIKKDLRLGNLAFECHSCWQNGGDIYIAGTVRAATFDLCKATNVCGLGDLKSDVKNGDETEVTLKLTDKQISFGRHWLSC